MSGVRGAAIVALTLVGTACGGSRPSTLGPANGGLADCPGTPNCVHTGNQDPEGTRPIFMAPNRTGDFAAVVEVVEGMTRTTVVSATENYLHAEARSLIFRFVDDVEVLLRDSGELVVRSASRLGKGDMGVNARRVEELRARLEEAGLVR